MVFFRFMRTPVGRTLRIVAGLLFLAYGTVSPTLSGLLAMMAGIVSIVTGLTRLPPSDADAAAQRLPAEARSAKAGEMPR